MLCGFVTDVGKRGCGGEGWTVEEAGRRSGRSCHVAGDSLWPRAARATVHSRPTTWVGQVRKGQAWTGSPETWRVSSLPSMGSLSDLSSRSFCRARLDSMTGCFHSKATRWSCGPAAPMMMAVPPRGAQRPGARRSTPGTGSAVKARGQLLALQEPCIVKA